MTQTTLLPPATTPTAPTTHRAFIPSPGSYEAICAAAAVQHELEAILSLSRTDGLSRELLEERLVAVRLLVDAATNAHVRSKEAC